MVITILVILNTIFLLKFDWYMRKKFWQDMTVYLDARDKGIYARFERNKDRKGHYNANI